MLRLPTTITCDFCACCMQPRALLICSAMPGRGERRSECCRHSVPVVAALMLT